MELTDGQPCTYRMGDSMTVCGCGARADVIERGAYVCATCWIKLYGSKFKLLWRMRCV